MIKKQEIQKLEEKVLKDIKAEIPKKTTLILAISGGPDSIFLLEMFLKTTHKIIVAHVNHNLRGEESDNEAIFVEKICKSSNIIFEKLSIDIAKIAKKEKQSIEECGRKQRYKFFESLKNRYKAKYIVTAHHANDNIETFLLNIIRGAGLQGLKGMDTLHKSLYRPLLEIEKQEILSYLKNKNIKFKNESSNKDIKYKRNLLRLEIIPKIKEINPNFEKTLSKNIPLIKENLNIIEELTEDWIAKFQIKKNQYNAKAFRESKAALQKNILRKFHEILIGNTYNLENIHIKEAQELINNNIGNKEKKLGKIKVKIKSNTILIEKI